MFNDDELKYIRDRFKTATWWQSVKIYEKINDYFEQKDKEKKCQHEFADYIIKHNRCKKCGQIDMSKGESESLIGSGFDN